MWVCPKTDGGKEQSYDSSDGWLESETFPTGIFFFLLHMILMVLGAILGDWGTSRRSALAGRSRLLGWALMNT